MAIVRAFKAIRPSVEYADKVAALPYDVMNSSEARKMVSLNPYSFLHIDKAEIDLPEDTYIYDDRVYQKAKENFNSMVEKGIFIQDEKPCLYIYRLTMNGRSQTGLVCCCSIDEYINNKIKKHELTREEKELDRIKHVDTLDANTGPIFLTYRYKYDITSVIDKWIESHSAVYDFESDDAISHQAWVIDDDATIEKLIVYFGGVDNLYIADGHHRNASAVKVGLKRREENKNYSPDEEFNYYLCVAFPDNELKILDYNRVVKDLNGLSKEEFFEKIKEKFEISECEGYYKPKDLHYFGMYIDEMWYELKAKEEIISTDPVKGLDVSILQDNLLSPILDIKDPRTDNRIDFVGGIRGLGELERRVNSGEMAVAFSMYPTTMKQLMDIADNDKIMPPKSTWFEPKLRSGLFIHKLS